MQPSQTTLDSMMREQVQQAEMSRLQLMSRAIRAYNDHARAPLKIDPKTRIDDNVQINYTRTIVEKGVSFLFGEQLKIEIADTRRAASGAATSDAATPGADESGDDDALEDLLDDVWSCAQRGEDLIDCATNGGQTGHVWAQIVVEAGEPRVVVLDPLNMSAEWDERDIRRVVKYVNEWNSFDEHKRAVVRRQTATRNGDSWLIDEFISYSNKSTWTRVGATVVWRYRFAPIFHTKNLPKACEFYGQPDLTLGVLQLNHYIARVDSLINRIIRIHAHPKTIAYGMQPDDLKIGVDGVLFVDEYEAELKNLEMQSDLSAAQTFRDKLRSALAEVSHVPEVTTGKVDKIGALSGRAMQLLYSPLIDQTKKKRLTYGRFVVELICALLTIKGRVIKPRDVTLHWGSMLPADEKEAAETALIKKQVGFSTDTLVQELGGDPDNEREKVAAETEAQGAAMAKAFNAGRGAGADVYGAGAGGSGAFGAGAPGGAAAGALAQVGAGV